MQSLRVNDYDMAYLDLGPGQPLVCIHGSISDFRIWAPVMKPLSAGHRLIVPSLRHFFPEHWDGRGGKFTLAQHLSDIIAFIEALSLGPVDLIGHSRGGYLGFRLAQQRPDLLRCLVLAEPAGMLDGSLAAPAAQRADAPAAGSRALIAQTSEKIAAGDLEGGLRFFFEVVNGPGAWDALPASERQIYEDNAFTFIAQTEEGRVPYTRDEAEALAVPTLFVGGADTPGMLPVVLKALAEHVPGAESVTIPDADHGMFQQQPKLFCEAVLRFLDG